MPLPYKLDLLASTSVPETVEELGSDHPHLFMPMHLDTAEECLTCRMLLPSGMTPRHLGDRTVHDRYRRLPMPQPFAGRMADYAHLAFTPKTINHYASVSYNPPPNVTKVTAAAIVVAVVPLEDLRKSGLPIVFSDSSPHHPKATMTEAVGLIDIPWDLLRKTTFSDRSIHPDRLRFYHATLLAFGLIPLDLVTFAVRNEEAAIHLRQRARDLDAGDVRIVIRSAFFFGRR